MNRPGADPRTEPAWLTRIKQGYALLQQGRAEIAERVGREVLDSRPGEAVALNLVAIALNAQGRYADAAQLFAELTRVQPQERSHWGNLGTALRAAGQLQPALDAYQQAAMLGDKSANFHYNVGLLHLDRDDFDAARAMLAEAHRLAPRDAEIAYQYGVACNESTRTHEGARALANWSQFEGLTTELVAKFAVLLMNLGQTGAAEAALALARQDARPSASARLQIVLALERTNRLADARRELDALLVSSQTPQADLDVRAANGKLAQREGDHETAARVYRELAERCDKEERRHYHLFPLAKSLDALGRYDEAFAALKQAHQSQQRFMELTSPGVGTRKREPMRITRHGADPLDIEQWSNAGAPAAEDSPVFIVAYPRSGTTLLEHTLDAHPGLRTMDEQPFIQAALERLSRSRCAVSGAHGRLDGRADRRGTPALLVARRHAGAARAGSASARQESAQHPAPAGDTHACFRTRRSCSRSVTRAM